MVTTIDSMKRAYAAMTLYQSKWNATRFEDELLGLREAIKREEAQTAKMKSLTVVGIGKEYRPDEHERGEWREEDGICIEYPSGYRACFYASEVVFQSEEAQTVEPVGQVLTAEEFGRTTLQSNVIWLSEPVPGSLLFTHPAPPPSGERAALIERLSEAIAVAITMLYESHKADTIAEFSLEELTFISRISEPLGTKQVEKIYRAALRALDILAADAQRISELEELRSAQQVAVPQVVNTVGVYPEWVRGPSLFKDWCSEFFGPDADENYVALAIRALPMMDATPLRVAIPTDIAQQVEVPQGLLHGLRDALKQSDKCPEQCGTWEQWIAKIDANLASPKSLEHLLQQIAEFGELQNQANQTRELTLLREARNTLETWRDVVPAVSLCKDIDAVLSAKGSK